MRIIIIQQSHSLQKLSVCMLQMKISPDILCALAEVCQSDQPLRPDMISALDTITANYSSAYDQEYVNFCHDAWSLVQHSNKFWQNANLILFTSNQPLAILQILIICQERVRKNWVYESPQTRECVKKLMCNFVTRYTPKMQEPVHIHKAQFRKINCIITEILKFQWSGDWKTFLSDILNTMQQTPVIAQNYFDLIKIIFEEIFIQDDLLTSNQIRCFRNNINENSLLLFNTFQFFFNRENPFEIIRSCLQALQVIIPTLSPPKIYLNFSYEKMISLLMVPHLQLCVLDCTIAIFRMKYDDQIQKIIGSKVIHKKQRMLVQILNEMNPEVEENIRQKIIDLASFIVDDLVEEQLKIMRDCQDRQILRKNNYFISAKLVSILTTNPLQASDLKIYKFILKHSEIFDFQNLMNKLIHLTTFPFNCSFFKDIKLFMRTDDYAFEDSTSEQSIIMNEIIKEIIQSDKSGTDGYECQYITALIKQIKTKVTTMDALKYYCRACWHFYQLLSNSKQVYESIFIFINFIHDTDNQFLNTKFMNEEEKRFNSRIILINRANFLLLVSHKRVMETAFLQDCFYIALQKCFLQCDHLFAYSLDLLKQIRKQVKFIKIQKEIMPNYYTYAAHRQNRIRFDELILDFLLAWLEENKKQFHQIYNEIFKILVPYRNKINELRRKKTNPRQMEVHSWKVQLIENGYKLLRMYKILLGYPNFTNQVDEQCIQQLQFLMMLKQTSDDIKQIDKVQKFQLIALDVENSIILNLLPKVNEESEFKKCTGLLATIINNINNQLVSLSSINFDRYDQENQPLTKLLILVANFINSISMCCGDQKARFQMVKKIIYHVNSIGFDCLNSAHLKYLVAIVKTKYFELLDADCVATIIYQLFDYARSNVEDHVMTAYENLSCILTQTIEKMKICGQDSPNKQALEHFIVHFTCKIFSLIISQNLNKHFLEDFCELLYLSLEVVKSLRNKFHDTQLSSNLYEIYLQHSSIIRKQYCCLSNETLNSLLEHSLKTKIQTTQNFSIKMRDFLIELKRGFIQTTNI